MRIVSTTSVTVSVFLDTFTQYFQDEYKSLIHARGENRGIHVDVIVYIFAHLYTALRTEGNMLDIN